MRLVMSKQHQTRPSIIIQLEDDVMMNQLLLLLLLLLLLRCGVYLACSGAATPRRRANHTLRSCIRTDDAAPPSQPQADRAQSRTPNFREAVVGWAPAAAQHQEQQDQQSRA